MKALKQIGSPEVAQHGTMIFWSSAILGGLNSTILRTNRVENDIFTITPSTMDFDKTAEEQYRTTLEALNERLGKPHLDESSRNSPWVLWFYDYVVLSLRIYVDTMGEEKCEFEIRKRQ
jgi:hypothetical protein